jgi:arylsulfatase A
VSARAAHFYFQAYRLQAVRSGPWKLALEPQGFSMGFTETPERHGESQPGLRLYNLQTDIGETTNVAAQHPDVVQRLKAMADHEAAILCDGSPKGPGVRPAGYVENPQFLYPVKESAKQRAKKARATAAE